VTFRARRTLRFGDCDPAGIAYFPRYLDLLNGVVEEWWGTIGFPWTELFGRRRIGLPTVRCELDFTAPGRMGDLLEFGLGVARLGRRSLTLQHDIRRDQTPLWRAIQVVVATGLEDHRAIDWPDDLRAAIIAFREEGHAPGSAA
jgi:4-hydroxybenzoyl-CoA thioesterase